MAVITKDKLVKVLSIFLVLIQNVSMLIQRTLPQIKMDQSKILLKISPEPLILNSLMLKPNLYMDCKEMKIQSFTK